MEDHLSRLRGAVVVALVVAAALPAAANADPEPFLDVRTTVPAAAASPAPPQRIASDRGVRAARADLTRELGEQGVLDIDPVTGTARSVQRLDGALTGPSPQAPADRALGYVERHTAALGLDRGDLGTLVAEPARRSPSGTTTVRWRQEVDGVPAFDNGVTVHVDDDGRVLAVQGSPLPDLPAAVGTPALGAADALRAAMADVGATGDVQVTGDPEGAERRTRFADGHEAQLVLFGGAGGAVLAWRVLLRAGAEEVYDTVVDAGDGRILRRANLVKAADEAVVHPGWPGNALGPVEVSLTPWLYMPAQRAEAQPPLPDTTFGPYAWAWGDINPDNQPQGYELALRNPDDGTFRWPLQPFGVPERPNPNGNCDDDHLCTWDGDVAESWLTNMDAAIVSSFWLTSLFHDHLAADPIGFGPEDGNFAGDDPVYVNALDGAATNGGLVADGFINNANMLTLPDGIPGRMQMYLATTRGGYSQRDVSYDFDAATVWHEYAHGLSNRLVTNSGGFGALNSPQAGAMGEGWSDFYALDLLADPAADHGPISGAAIVDTDADGEVSLGAYPDPVLNATRKQFIDCTPEVDSPACPGGGLTYADFGKVRTRGPEVHDDGEIWAQTLWELRKQVGIANARFLVTEGMRLSPPEPSFLDARNGILAATGDNDALRAQAWAVFASRGMGLYAAATGGADVEPVADFTDPADVAGAPGTVTGTVADVQTGAPVAGAEVGLGSAGGAGVADVTGADGAFAIAAPPGTYPGMTVAAPGYEAAEGLSDPVTVSAGATTAVGEISLRRNWVLESGGATIAQVTPDLCNETSAIDGSQATGWSGSRWNQDDTPRTPSMTITLPRAVDISGFVVDPSETCFDDGGAAVGRLRIETSSGGAFTTAAEPTFDAADRYRLNDVAPTGGTSGVTQIRVTLLEPQSSAPGQSGEDWIDLTELKVYGTPTPTPTPSGGGGGGAAPGPVAPEPQPQPTPPAPAPVDPPAPPRSPAEPPLVTEAVLPRAGVAGRVTALVTCATRCRVHAQLVASRRLARRIGAPRRLAGARDRLAAGSTGRVTVRLRRQHRRALRRLDRDDRVRLTLVVAVTDADGQVTRERRRVRVRV